MAGVCIKCVESLVQRQGMTFGEGLRVWVFKMKASVLSPFLA